MNSPESQEFVAWRDAIYAAEASKCPAPVVIEPEQEFKVCMCCHERKAIFNMCEDCRGEF